MSKLRFIAYCVMISFFLAVCIFGVVFFSVKKTPDFEELKTEECTFVKQKYYPWWSEFLNIESRYDIYVEEREKPFVISQIVFEKIDEEALDSLQPGDRVTVTYDEAANHPYVYTLKSGDKTVFSYEDYAEAESKNTIGLQIFFSVLSVFFAASLAACIVIYVKKPFDGRKL